MILTVEPGRGGEGSFVNRNNDSNCRTRERGGGRGYLTLGTMIVGVERGRGGGGSFVSRNNDSNCRSRERWGRIICL